MHLIQLSRVLDSQQDLPDMFQSVKITTDPTKRAQCVGGCSPPILADCGDQVPLLIGLNAHYCQGAGSAPDVEDVGVTWYLTLYLCSSF